LLIAILSDTHSRYATVEKVLALLSARGVNHVIHCGDIEDSDTVWLFQGLTAHFVLGNCDTDRASLRQAIYGIGETLHEPFGQLELEGARIAFLHGDDKRLMDRVERSGQFDYLFYGHTHQTAEHRTGATRVINPGALYRVRLKTFVLLDPATGDLESVTVE
jgi:putative phosphoesterase